MEIFEHKLIYKEPKFQRDEPFLKKPDGMPPKWNIQQIFTQVGKGLGLIQVKELCWDKQCGFNHIQFGMSSWNLEDPKMGEPAVPTHWLTLMGHLLRVLLQYRKLEIELEKQ